jgi:hypothetical protein
VTTLFPVFKQATEGHREFTEAGEKIGIAHFADRHRKYQLNLIDFTAFQE